MNAPQGVLVNPGDGSVWVIDSGLGGDQQISIPSPEGGAPVVAKLGNTARIVRVGSDGSQTTVVSLPSALIGDESTGGARLALLNNAVYATHGYWDATLGQTDVLGTGVSRLDGDKLTQVAALWTIENTINPDGFAPEAHPYGLAAGPDGNLWATDAGGNTLLKVNPATGNIEVVAVLPGIAGPFPNPARKNAQELDPVPTSVAFDRGGNIYVSLLSGGPFPPGAAKVVKIEPGRVVDYATGLTMLTDLRSGPDGNMYAVQFGIFGEQGPTPNSGSIVRIKPGGATEVVLSGLSFPTSIDFTAAGDAYIAINGAGAPGSGAVVRYSALTAQAGTAPSQPAVPSQLPNTGGDDAPAAWLLALGAGLLVGGGALLGRARRQRRPA